MVNMISAVASKIGITLGIVGSICILIRYISVWGNYNGQFIFLFNFLFGVGEVFAILAFCLFLMSGMAFVIDKFFELVDIFSGCGK